MRRPRKPGYSHGPFRSIVDLQGNSTSEAFAIDSLFVKNVVKSQVENQSPSIMSIVGGRRGRIPPFLGLREVALPANDQYGGEHSRHRSLRAIDENGDVRGADRKRPSLADYSPPSH